MDGFATACLLSVAYGNRKQLGHCENTRWLEKIWLQDTKNWGNTNVINKNERILPVRRHSQKSRRIVERTRVSWTVLSTVLLSASDSWF